TTQSNLFGRSVDPLTGGSVPLLGTGTRAFVLTVGLALVCIYSLFQYRWLGLVTIASLVVAGVITYLAITLLGWGANYRLSL
ncbi:hypothetical protein NPS74_23945, partial [Cutibacterium acnes subsp. acnes]|nr:hypothetical protein [Cutibacterium acnes subsp. acnes]